MHMYLCVTLCVCKYTLASVMYLETVSACMHYLDVYLCTLCEWGQGGPKVASKLKSRYLKA